MFYFLLILERMSTVPFWPARFSGACCVTMHTKKYILKTKSDWPHSFVAADQEFGIVDITWNMC